MEISCRFLSTEDAPRLSHLANNKKIWDCVRDGFPSPYQTSDAEHFIQKMRASKTDRVFGIFGFEEGLVGVVGVHPLQDIYFRTAEIGYWVGEPYWGKQIASRALTWVVRDTWENTNLLRLEAGVFSFNPSSMRVLEKCSFTKESIKRQRLVKNGEVWDEHMYVLLRP